MPRIFWMGSFLRGFPTRTLYTFLSSSMQVITCPAHLIFIDLICPMIFGDENRLWNSVFAKIKLRHELDGRHDTILYTAFLRLCNVQKADENKRLKTVSF
jgi:hypothetical protein